MLRVRLEIARQTIECDRVSLALSIDPARTVSSIFYQLKNGCNWEDLPKDLLPYSTVYWHYKQWREAGSIKRLMTVLHEQVREEVKKS